MSETIVRTETCNKTVMREYEPIPSQYNGEKAYTSGLCAKPLPCPEHPRPTTEARCVQQVHDMANSQPCGLFKRSHTHGPVQECRDEDCDPEWHHEFIAPTADVRYRGSADQAVP